MKKFFLLLTLVICSYFSFAQLPSNVLVGYHENWRTLKLSQVNSNYNVICLAFALPSSGTSYNMQYSLPAGYTSISQMTTDIDALHAQGKKVLLSIGGATAYIYLNNTTERDAFVTSVNNIMAAYSYKIDGIDLDLEKNINTGQNSMAFGSTWTMSAPAAAQTHMINAVKSIMSNYQTQTSKKMLLTAAPEAVYLLGALSSWQIVNANGGAFLPILDGLRTEIDCLHMQLYNAGGSGGGIIAWNGTVYYDDGTIAFALAMNESMIKGFTLLSGKGTFASFPASKLAMGFPATSAPNAAGTGYLTPANVCNAARYFKGEIAKPAGCTYTMTAAYPTLKGLMTWSINEDSYLSYPFVGAYTCAFSSTAAPVANFNKSLTTACVGQTVTFTDASTNTPNAWSWNFGSGASTATASTQGAHSISYSTTGTKTIALTATNGGGSNATSQTISVVAASGNAGAITGNTSVCQTSSQTYSISPVSGATTYTWTVPSGSTITAGQGTTAITVTMGSKAGNITVSPISNCGNGTAATLAVSTAGGSAPLVEGFETSVPPSNWTLNNADNGTTWSRTTAAFATGTASAKMTFFGYTANLGTKDELQTQAISFVGKTSHTLTFKHAYAWMDRTGTANDRRDSLRILVSTDCGNTWTQLFYKGGNTLSTLTSGAGQQAAFTPTSGQWVSNNIDLSAYDGQSGVIIKFVAINRNGNNLYLDDININGTTTVAPIADFSANKTTVCAGGTVVFTDASSNAPTNYSWDFGAGASPAIATGVGPHTVTYSTSGTPTVTLVVSNISGSNTNTKTNYISVDPLPSAAGAISGGASVCEGATGNVFTISSVSNVSDYTWTVPSGSTITAGMGSTSITVTFGSTAGDITITPSNACGNGTAAILPIALTNSVAPTIFIAATDTSICSGQQVDFTANTANGGLTPTYVWKINGTPSGSNTATFSTSLLNDQDVVSAELTSSEVCSSANPAISNNVKIEVLSAPSSPSLISGNTSVMQGDVGELYSTSMQNGITYNWNYSGTGVINGSGNSITLDFDVNDLGGDLTVNATNSCGTSAPSAITIAVNPLTTAVQTNENAGSAKVYPNPFNESALAEFTLAKSEIFSVKIIDAQGRLIKNYGNVSFAAGKNIFPLDVDVESGIYFIQFVGAENEFKLSAVKIK